MKFDILYYRFGKVSAVLAVLLVWACIYLPGLGNREVQGNEPKRTLPALAMIQSGNWINPELAGEKYYKKPPLINWMIATSFTLTGNTSEFSARLPSALTVLCFALLIVLMPSGFLTHPGKIICAMIFLSSLGIIDKGRLIEIDGAYTAITGMAVLSWLNFRTLKSSGWLLWIVPGIFLGLGLLLKGPLILVFFYSVVFLYLYYEKKFKELRSIHHVAGIVVMLLIFSIWAITVLLSKQTEQPAGNSESQVASKMSSEWLSDILDNVIGMDSLKGDKPWWVKFSAVFIDWARNIVQALFYFLPWLLFIPFFRRDSWFEKLPDEGKIIVKTLFWSLVIGMGCLMLQPGVRARYFVPLVAIACLMTGFMLSHLQDNSKSHRTWRNIILALSLMSALTLSAGIFLVNMRFMPKLFVMFKVKPPAPMDYIFYLPTLLTSILTVGFLVYFFRNKDRFSDSLRLSLASAAFTAIVVFQLYCFTLPVIRQFEVKRPAGMAINKCMPPGETLNLFNFGIMNYEPFLYYIRPPVRYVFDEKELAEKDKYVLFEGETYGRIVNDYGIASREPRKVLDLTFKKTKYVIIRFEKPPPKISGVN